MAVSALSPLTRARPAPLAPVESGPPPTFVNWENPHVHPIDMTPDGTRLLVCNTADARLEVFDVTTGTPIRVGSVPVGVDPVSVRARTNTQAWVVNHISDSVSVVDLSTMNVVASLRTLDEPCDVVFAGTPQRAFVSCSQANAVLVFDPSNLSATATTVPINAEDPRALAVSPDGQTVYAAIFESGNKTTILGGGIDLPQGILNFPPNVVSLASTPYGGQNPPPNSGTSFSPPIAAGNNPPVKVGLIVRQNAAGQWMDDNNRDWTAFVSGASATQSGRRVGWSLPDRDLAMINASNLGVTYATGLMNLCMAVGVNPATGNVAVVGTEALNHIRFEPNVNGRFLRVNVALVNPAAPTTPTIKDLNAHLTYATPTLPLQADRDKGLGDPRAIAFNAAGSKGYVAGMGSNNLVVIDAAGNRAGLTSTIEVGEGPTGIVVDDARSRLYVLNRFASTISVVSTNTETVLATVPFFDPSPAAIKVGRKHLYDTHKTSGLGIVSCASCHADARMDRLAWDLGDPRAAIRPLTGQNLGGNIPGLSPQTSIPPFQPFHPMKGPMVTQTLQDIIGHEPFHWRGDRNGLEEFNAAFTDLLGDDVQLSVQEMQEFEDFLATIAFPPNPFRNFDNTLPTSLPLTGMFTTGRFGASGAAMPNGNAVNGLSLFRSFFRRLDNGNFACSTCHTMPTGLGTDSTFNIHTLQMEPFPVGPMGERHVALVPTDGSTNIAMKVPQLRNLYDKLGFDMTQLENRAGFGFIHDGSVDSLVRFISEPTFAVFNNQEIADLVALMMAWSGSDLPTPAGTTEEPPGVPGKDSHAAVGWQTTLVSEGSAAPAQLTLISNMIALAQANKVGLIVKGRVGGESRGYVYRSDTSLFQSDRAGQSLTPSALRALAAAGSELTYTVVPFGTQTRMGIDRDLDGILDGDVGDPTCYANCDGSTIPPVLNVNDFSCFLNKFGAGDPGANCDGSVVPPVLNINDFVCFVNKFSTGCP
ncbi:MAG: beta-propeller fold lactonase family protein [Phycisphaerae bacterium]|nr:beta-propeller fold lactonase family protein [Phycisphaerae bacterium]